MRTDNGIIVILDIQFLYIGSNIGAYRLPTTAAAA